MDSANKADGVYGLTVQENDSTTNNLYQTQQDWSTSTSYTVELEARTDGGSAGGRVEVKNDTTGTVLGSVNITGTTWQPYSFTFTSPSNNTQTGPQLLTSAILADLITLIILSIIGGSYHTGFTGAGFHRLVSSSIRDYLSNHTKT